MPSPFSKTFLAIMDRIKSQVPAIKHIDQDLGQLEHYDTIPSVSWPCLLIDNDEFEFDDRGDNTQSGKGFIILRLGFTPYSSSSSITPPTYRQMALKYYDLEFAIHMALQGWSPDPNVLGALSRKRATTERRNDSIRVREIRYSIGYEDYDTIAEIETAGAQYNPDYGDDYANKLDPDILIEQV